MVEGSKDNRRYCRKCEVIFNLSNGCTPSKCSLCGSRLYRQLGDAVDEDNFDEV
jgi:rRNA maturation endonuclease Nob1